MGVDHTAVLLLAGLALGFANTLASSGSAISLPVLLTMGLGAELANGTNRVAVLAAALASAGSFIRAGKVQWRLVVPLAVACAAGSIAGAAISEVIAPARIHLAIVGALLVAVVLLFARPSRWLATASDRTPEVGLTQLLLVAAVGVWMGFIFLDSGTYLLVVLVLSVGFDLTAANAAKGVLVAVSSATSVPILAAGHNIDWGVAGWLAAGAVAGGIGAARVALHPAAGPWIYRLIVVMVVGELVHLGLADLRL